MATYTKTYTLTITEGAPNGNTVYEAIDKLEDNVDGIITNLNACHTSARGDIIYKGASAVSALTVGSAAQFLRSNGTDPSWSFVDKGEIEDAPSSDHDWSGWRTDATSGEALAIGQVVYFKSDGKWWLADADAASTCGQLGLVLETASGADESVHVLLFGVMRDDTWNWTVGGKIYVSTTAGGMTQTEPTAGGDQIQVAGYATHADRMMFAPAGQFQDVERTHPVMRSGAMQRPVFTYNGGAGGTAYTIKVKAASYYVKEKFAFWDSELTTAAIGTPVASTRYYLYLDYSAITAGTEVTNAALAWSSTAPTWSDTYKGWYNSDDRCIFGVITNSGPTNIDEFYHDGGDYVEWADEREERAAADLDSTFVDCDCATAAPAFCSRLSISCQLEAKTGDAVVVAYWRRNGQTGSTGHKLITLERIGTDQVAGCSGVPVMTDSAQIFEVKMSRDGDDTLQISVDGFYLPTGI